jgi:hypothetical protein
VKRIKKHDRETRKALRSAAHGDLLLPTTRNLSGEGPGKGVSKKTHEGKFRTKTVVGEHLPPFSRAYRKRSGDLPVRGSLPKPPGTENSASESLLYKLSQMGVLGRMGI